MLGSMATMDEPTARARRMVASRRRYYLVGAILLVAACATGAWALVASSAVIAIVCALVLVVAIVLVLVPYLTERYVSDFDNATDGSATRRRVRAGILVAAILGVVGNALGLAGPDVGSGLALVRWVLLVGSAALALFVIGQMVVDLRRPDDRPPRSASRGVGRPPA